MAVDDNDCSGIEGEKGELEGCCGSGKGKGKGKGGLGMSGWTGGDKFKGKIVFGMNALPVVPTGTSTFNDPAAVVTTTSSVSRKIGEEVP